jgi:hypothetical protein
MISLKEKNAGKEEKKNGPFPFLSVSQTLNLHPGLGNQKESYLLRTESLSHTSLASIKDFNSAPDVQLNSSL